MSVTCIDGRTPLSSSEKEEPNTWTSPGLQHRPSTRSSTIVTVGRTCQGGPRFDRRRCEAPVRQVLQRTASSFAYAGRAAAGAGILLSKGGPHAAVVGGAIINMNEMLRRHLSNRRKVALAVVGVFVVALMAVLTALRGAGSSWPLLVCGGLYVITLVRYWLARKDDQA